MAALDLLQGHYGCPLLEGKYTPAVPSTSPAAAGAPLFSANLARYSVAAASAQREPGIPSLLSSAGYCC